MRIVFAVSDPHIPHLIGGGPMDIHHLALALAAEQHDVSVLAGLRGGRRLLPYRARQSLRGQRLLFFRDVRNGYETVRAGSWLVPMLLEERIGADPPDVVITQGGGITGIVRVAIHHNVPVLMRGIDVASIELLAASVARDPELESLLRSPLFRMLSISDFVASKARDLLGLHSSVIRPLVRLEDCVASSRRPEYITFVNPILLKGLAVALAVAALLPDRQFLFIDAWSRSAQQRRELDHELGRLPNVTFRRSSTGLKDVYESTAVLLMPSQCQEGFGRVVVEACVNGIPVVASRIGGLPEAMGQSGILLDPQDPPERWAEAIEQILSDAECYSRFEASALANAQRDDLRERVILERFHEVYSDLRRAGPGSDVPAQAQVTATSD
jgi:glycosyltransferase involved in cell wall biosynthesis